MQQQGEGASDGSSELEQCGSVRKSTASETEPNQVAGSRSRSHLCASEYGNSCGSRSPLVIRLKNMIACWTPDMNATYIQLATMLVSYLGLPLYVKDSFVEAAEIRISGSHRTQTSETRKIKYCVENDCLVTLFLCATQESDCYACQMSGLHSCKENG